MGKNKVAIVAIARLENDYINEWIGHHLGIGVNHIYVYDNSSSEEEKLHNIIYEKYLIRSQLDMIFKENTMKLVFKKYFLVGKGKKEKLLHTTFDLTSQDYSCKEYPFENLVNDLYDTLSSRWYKSTIKRLIL